MTLQPYEKAQASLGKELVNAEDVWKYKWLGDGHIIMHNVLENGKLVQFVVGSIDQGAEGSDQWQCKVNAEKLSKFFDTGVPGLNGAIREVSRGLHFLPCEAGYSNS